MEKPINYGNARESSILTPQGYEELKAKVNEERKRVIQAINDEPLTRYITLQLAQKTARSSGYICPICGSGTGVHKTGALKISSNNEVTCFSNDCFGGNGYKGTDTLGALCIIDQITVDEALKKYGGFVWLDKFREFKEYYLKNEPVPLSPIRLSNESGSPVIKTRSNNKPKEEKPDPVMDFSRWINNGIQALWSSNKALAYLRDRGLSDDTIREFRLGFNNGYILIPYPDINTYMIKRATFTDDSGKKYRKPSKDIAGHEPLFGEANLKKGKPVIVVEGPFDAMSVSQCGGLAVALVTTGATVGFERAVEKIPKDQRPVFILALDNDVEKEDGRRPGQDGQVRLKNYLDSIQANYIEFPLSGTCKDANELLQTNEDLLRQNIEIALRQAEA